MNLQISCTQDGIKSYPHHSHNFWEIITYFQGTGYLYTEDKNILFKPGTIILVPPKTLHGSVSENGFKNISIGGSFQNSLFFDEPVCINDTDDQEGTSLAMLIFKNNKSDAAYINSLTNAFIHFCLNRINLQKPINLVINEILTEISENFDNAHLSISQIMELHNYTKDYIRQQFKKATGMHPTEFLTKRRIEKACFLIEIYGNTVPLSQIAEKCGYLDYVYFSKQFKCYKNMSPQKYLKTIKRD